MIINFTKEADGTAWRFSHTKERNPDLVVSINVEKKSRSDMNLEEGVYIFYSICSDDVEHSMLYDDKSISDVAPRDLRCRYFTHDDFIDWMQKSNDDKIAGHTRDHFCNLLGGEINERVIFIDTLAWRIIH